MKTELKDCLHHYLNTGLKIQAKGGMIYTLNFEIYNLTIISGWKPLLLPMSALTEPLEDGTIPIDYIEKNIHKDIDFYMPLNIDLDLEVCIRTADYSQEVDLFDGFLIMQKLFEWHFDVYGLIESGQAIDKRTVK